MRKESGQSLVEMAIITPVLVFLMIGVFEVGYALYGYLVLINANREAARFSVRPGYLAFEGVDSPGWEKVLTQTITAGGGQIDINYEDKGTLVLAYIEANTGPVGYDPSDCEGGRDCITAYNLEFLDDCLRVYTATIKTPANYPTFTVTYGPSQTTRFDYERIAGELATTNRRHNCELAIKGGAGGSDGLIIAETWFEQEQLLGFPLISNPLLDPVPMYASSVFRRIQAVRGTGQGD
jgi:hypothetical protein